MTESTASLMKLNLLFQLKTRATFWLFQNIRNKNKCFLKRNIKGLLKKIISFHLNCKGLYYEGPTTFDKNIVNYRKYLKMSLKKIIGSLLKVNAPLEVPFQNIDFYMLI